LSVVGSTLSQGGVKMSAEIGLFWLIHFFIGVVLPAMVFLGCCMNKEDANSGTYSVAVVSATEIDMKK
jgi:hypothetical protein